MSACGPLWRKKQGKQNDAEAKAPILWPPDAKSWLIWKDPDAGKDWRQEEKGVTEDEMVVWHHRLNGQELGYTLGVGDGQGGLACCSSWVTKSRTRLSDWTELNHLGKGLSVSCESESRSVVSNSLQCHGLYIVHGILQARILEWVAYPFSRNWTRVPCIAGDSLPTELSGNPKSECTVF